MKEEKNVETYSDMWEKIKASKKKSKDWGIYGDSKREQEEGKRYEKEHDEKNKAVKEAVDWNDKAKARKRAKMIDQRIDQAKETRKKADELMRQSDKHSKPKYRFKVGDKLEFTPHPKSAGWGNNKAVKEEIIPMPTEYGGEYTVRKIYETSKVGKSIKVYGDPGPIEKGRIVGKRKTGKSIKVYGDPGPIKNKKKKEGTKSRINDYADYIGGQWSGAWIKENEDVKVMKEARGRNVYWDNVEEPKKEVNKQKKWKKNNSFSDSQKTKGDTLGFLTGLAVAEKKKKEVRVHKSDIAMAKHYNKNYDPVTGKRRKVQEEIIPMPTEYGGEYTVRKIYDENLDEGKGVVWSDEARKRNKDKKAAWSAKWEKMNDAEKQVYKDKAFDYHYMNPVKKKPS